MGGKVGIVLHLVSRCGGGQSQQPGRRTRTGKKMRLREGRTVVGTQSRWARFDTSPIIRQFVFIPAPMSVPLDSSSITHGIQQAIAVFLGCVASFFAAAGWSLAKTVISIRRLNFSVLQKKGSIR